MVSRHEVRAATEKQTHDVGVTVSRGNHERCPRVARCHVDVGWRGLVVQQTLTHLDQSAFRSEVQWRLTESGLRVDKSVLLEHDVCDFLQDEFKCSRSSKYNVIQFTGKSVTEHHGIYSDQEIELRSGM